MSELVEKWKETGLLHELEDKEEKLSESLEEAYQYLISFAEADDLENVPDDFQWKAGIILPALSRVYRQDDVSEIDGEKFAKTFMKVSEEQGYKETVENMNTHHAVYGEAEICQMFVEHYLQYENQK